MSEFQPPSEPMHDDGWNHRYADPAEVRAAAAREAERWAGTLERLARYPDVLGVEAEKQRRARASGRWRRWLLRWLVWGPDGH